MTTMKNLEKTEIYWIAAAAFLPVILFFPHWLGPMALGDNFIELQPHYKFIFEQIRNISDPVWNPYLFSGFPIIAYPSASPYNLLAWAHLIPPTVIASNIHILLFYSCAAVGFYYFARCLGIGAVGAFASAAIYSCAGYVLVCFPSIFGYGGMPWIGFALGSIERLRLARGFRDRFKWTLIFALFLSVEYLAGHPFIFLQTCIFAGFYTLIVGVALERGGSRWKWYLCVLTGVSFVPLIGAVMLVPGWQIQQLSWRKTISFEYFSGASFRPGELLRSIIFYRGTTNGLFTASIGAMPFLAAIYAAIETRDVRYRAMTFIAAFSLLSMLGNVTPLPRLLFHVPLLKLIAGMERYGILFSISSSILAGLGIEKILQNKRSIIKLFSVLIIIILTATISAVMENEELFVKILPDILIVVTIFIFLLFAARTSNKYWLAAALFAFIIGPKIFIADMLREKINRVDTNTLPKILNYIAKPNASAGPPSRILTVTDLATHSMQSAYDMGAQNASEYEKLHNAAGYNPLLSERYSKLMNMDFVGFPNNFRQLIEPPALIPDLLNIENIIIPKRYIEENFYRLFPEGEKSIIDGIPSLPQLFVRMAKGEQLQFQTPALDVAGIGIVTAINEGADVPQGTEALQVTLFAADGSSREANIQAGIDTADVSYFNLMGPQEIISEASGIPLYEPAATVLCEANPIVNIYPAQFKAKGIAIVSALINGSSIVQGASSAQLTAYDKSGGKYYFPIRAGIETADFTITSNPISSRHQKISVVNTLANAQSIKGSTYLGVIYFKNIIDIDHIEISISKDILPASLFVTNITLIGADGQFAPARLLRMPQHKIAPIFNPPGKNNISKTKYISYYTNKKFDSQIAARRCVVKALLPSGKIHLRALTLIGRDPQSSICMTYLDYLLGDERRYEKREANEFIVWRNKSPWPRAWLAGEALWMKPDDILNALRSGVLPDGQNFDPWRTALVDEGQPFTLLGGGSARGSADIKKYTANEIQLESVSDRRSMLLLGETYYPGWRAWVDEIETRVYLTDYVLRGVIVDAGKHDVTFRFEPSSVRVGRTISIVTILLLTIAWLVVKARFPK